jgi:hypothetical protein
MQVKLTNSIQENCMKENMMMDRFSLFGQELSSTRGCTLNKKERPLLGLSDVSGMITCFSAV